MRTLEILISVLRLRIEVADRVGLNESNVSGGDVIYNNSVTHRGPVNATERWC